MFYAVIMAGGQGTRLWPMSRKSSPKQLQKLVSDKTLIEETVDRISPVFTPDRIIISTTPEYALIIRELLPEIPAENYVIEPFANNTAPACGLITSLLYSRDKEAVVSIIYSDHAVKNKEAFCSDLRKAQDLINAYPDHIITVGIKPTGPNTNFGYIQQGESNGEAYRVQRFVEKPDLEHAREYVDSGEYLWNSGMFVWQAEHYINLMNEYMPETQKVIDEIVAKVGSEDYEKFLSNNYGRTENTSIDYGIMEKTKDILVIAANFDWNDIGNWGTLHELMKEVGGTDVVSRGQHIGIGDSESLIYAGDKLVATVGLKDIVIVDTPDVLLVCNKNEAVKIKDVIARLKAEGKEEYL